MLAPHATAALEYWFFKVNAGPVALLVDWIVRRKVNEKILRVSVHSSEKREVVFEKLASDDQSFLGAERTVGQVGEVEWDLSIEAGEERIEPHIFPAKQLRLFDLTLVSAPRAAFTGWVRHGTQRVELRRAPGLVSHYWGRQLPQEWWWVSANQFDREGVAVEAMVLRSGVWGVPIGMPLAYLYLHHEGSRRLWIAPPGAVQVSGSPESFEIQFRPIGAQAVRLIGQGRDYGDLGEGILNTLVGDLELWEGDKFIARAQGTAGLERRFPEGGGDSSLPRSASLRGTGRSE